MEQRKGRRPTERMIWAAQMVAQRIQQPIPAGVLEDFDACQRFISGGEPAAPGKPTPRQLRTAADIASRHGAWVPFAARESREAMSQWLSRYTPRRVRT